MNIIASVIEEIMNKHIIKLLRFMYDNETNIATQRNTPGFWFFRQNNIDAYSGPERDENNNIIWYPGPDLDNLKRCLRIKDDNKIKEILIKAALDQYISTAFNRVNLSDKGKQYLQDITLDKKKRFREWVIPIVAAGISFIGSIIINMYFNNTEIKLLQSQIVQIQNQIEIKPDNK